MRDLSRLLHTIAYHERGLFIASASMEHAPGDVRAEPLGLCAGAKASVVYPADAFMTGDVQPLCLCVGSLGCFLRPSLLRCVY